MATKKKSRKIPRRTEPQRISADDSKFRELILLVSRKSEGDPRFGAVKLNKLLFYSDILAYMELGKPITGQEYFALPQGPAPRHMVPIREMMKKDGEIAIRKKETPYSGTQDRTFALREPDLSAFTPQEIDLVHSLIDRCWGHTGNELSDLTHKFAGWQLAKERETIPYTFALVDYRAPAVDEVKRGLDLEGPAAACLDRYAATIT